MLKKIVEFIVMELVEDTASVQVEEKHEDKKIILTIHINEQDRGKVIGKGGNTIRAIRSMAETLNEQQGTQVLVDIAK